MNAKRNWIAAFILIIGLIFTTWTYFNTKISNADVAVITSSKDRLDNKTEDAYQNHDEKRIQTLKLRVLSGKYRKKYL